MEQWQRALKDLRSWLGPAHVVFTGGEALLKPFTVDLAAYGTSLGMFIEVLTHGYWKDQSRIERLALTNPWRVTLSLDGIGHTHDLVRGRDGFFDHTLQTIENLIRLRKQQGLGYTIRLKTVVMSHNLESLVDLAEFATQDGVDILYQPIEQNYNSTADSEWYLHSDNWPRDPAAAASVIDRLIELKGRGRSIANTLVELNVMRSYFLEPDAWQISVKSHTAQLRKTDCSALGMFQVQSNGDVRVCCYKEPLGNIKSALPRDIWRSRPHWWENGCCLDERMSDKEKQHRLAART